MTYFYVCDNCGALADISDGPHPEGSGWACGDCRSTALWEFTDKDKAMAHTRLIRERCNAAYMQARSQR